jgi:hypothetical protein
MDAGSACACNEEGQRFSARRPKSVIRKADAGTRPGPESRVAVGTVILARGRGSRAGTGRAFRLR